MWPTACNAWYPLYCGNGWVNLGPRFLPPTESASSAWKEPGDDVRDTQLAGPHALLPTGSMLDRTTQDPICGGNEWGYMPGQLQVNCMPVTIQCNCSSAPERGRGGREALESLQVRPRGEDWPRRWPWRGFGSARLASSPWSAAWAWTRGQTPEVPLQKSNSETVQSPLKC